MTAFILILIKMVLLKRLHGLAVRTASLLLIEMATAKSTTAGSFSEIRSRLRTAQHLARVLKLLPSLMKTATA